MATNPFCVPCEQCIHWIEIDIRDENNQSFNEIKGTLTDAIGQSHSIRLSGRPLRIETLAAGPVTLTLETEPWLKAVKARKPRAASKPSPVKDDAEKDQGIYQLITVGDLWQSAPKVLPPERHLPSKEPLRLITDKSYKLEVKAFRYLTVRLGLFFDGTNNNTYSSNWGVTQWKNYLAFWASKCQGVSDENIETVAKSLAQSCQRAAPESLEGSAVNEWTNIQKLFAVYPPELHDADTQTLCFRTYVTGIGTENTTDSSQPAADDSKGLAFGEDDLGIEAKVTTGIKSVTTNFLSALEKTNIEDHHYDGIQTIALDVFGFSRGAAAARHCVNQFLLKENNPFAAALTAALASAFSENKLALCDAFNWQDNRHCTVKFVGIFDTVAAVAGDWSLDVNDNKNGDVKLWLDPDRIEKVIHLTAHPEDEYRHNFSLNKINPAPQFETYVLPGAHSDLGGGYFSRQIFAGYSGVELPLTEKKFIDVQYSNESYYGSHWLKPAPHVISESRAYSNIQQELQQKIQQGWGAGSFDIQPPSVVTEKNSYIKGYVNTKITFKLQINRVVEGDLSRLYLRVMFGLAVFHGVPLTNTTIYRDANDDLQIKPAWQDVYYTIPVFNSRTEPELYNRFNLNTPSKTSSTTDFATLCQEALELAKAGKVHPTLFTEDFRRAIKEHFMHHSADCITIFGREGGLDFITPNVAHKNLRRDEHECEADQ